MTSGGESGSQPAQLHRSPSSMDTVQQANPSVGAAVGSHASRVPPTGVTGPGGRQLKHSRQMSTRELTQKRLLENGSYTKFLKALVDCPYSINIRCNCGRSRNPAWMFICKHCCIGKFPPKDKKGTCFFF